MRSKPPSNLFSREDKQRDPRGPRWSVTSNSLAKVGTLQRHCRPDRTLDWEDTTRRAIGNAAFDRQYGLNFNVALGTAFYGDAAARIFQTAPGVYTGWYVKKALVFIDAPILLGHDFGLKRNGFVMAQFDDPRRGGTGILFVMREMRLEYSVAAETCALARYMTGRASLGDLKREARKEALAYIDEHRLKPWVTPELARRLRVLDYGCKSEKEIQSGLAPSKEELSWSAQYKKQGVSVRGIPQNWTHAVTVMEHLLKEGRVPGLPRMLIDPSCVWWLGGLAGGLVEPPPSDRVKRKNCYKRDEMYEDVADMVHYIAQAVYRSRDLSVYEAEDAKARGGGGSPVPAPSPPRSDYPGARRPPRLNPSSTYARIDTSASLIVEGYTGA